MNIWQFLQNNGWNIFSAILTFMFVYWFLFHKER